MSDSNSETNGAYRCDLCRDYPVELRPVCIVGLEEIPLLCSSCTRAIDAAGRLDAERDADVFGYSKEAIADRIRADSNHGHDQ